MVPHRVLAVLLVMNFYRYIAPLGFFVCPIIDFLSGILAFVLPPESKICFTCTLWSSLCASVCVTLVDE